MNELLAQAVNGLLQQVSLVTSTVAGFVILFGVIVLFHEFGHFSVAKLIGVRVFEFALGFGPSLAKRTWGDTVYSLRAVPLGGFVKVAGMDPTPENIEHSIPEDVMFGHKPLWQRLALVAAGPFMNFVLAFLLITAYHMTVAIPPTIQGLESGSPAVEAGLEPGDQIVSIDGHSTPTTRRVVELVRPRAGIPLQVSVLRGKQELSFTITPRFDEVTQVGMLGVILFDQEREALLPSLRRGVIETYQWSVGIARSIVRMIAGRIRTELSGPVGIFVITGSAVQEGLGSFLRLAILLNINLGLFNLLPIPILDGFWVLLLIIEAIRGRPLEPEQRGMAQFVGFALLLLLLVFATYQDVVRFFPGV